MKYLLLILLLLPGCSSLGIPTPWPTVEDVQHGDATTLAQADVQSAERVKALEASVEAAIGAEVAHTPADTKNPPPPVSGVPGGIGWTELLVTAAVVFLGRGIPSKGPIPSIVHGIAKAVQPKRKQQPTA